MTSEELRRTGQRVRLIVCDLDGTLLNEHKQISPRSLRAVAAAREKGVTTTICSGRIHTMLESYAEALGISGPLIAANGAVVYSAAQKTVLHGEAIAPEVLRPALNFLCGEGLDYSVLGDEACYFSANSVRIKRFEQYNEIARATGHAAMRLLPFGEGHENALAAPAYKLLVYALRPEQFPRARAFLQGQAGLAVTSSEENLLDVSAPGVSKGTGVAHLARLLGLQTEEVCVFGDYYNDVSMFGQAGLSFAMATAPADVQAAASALAAANTEDGVARAIEEYIL